MLMILCLVLAVPGFAQRDAGYRQAFLGLREMLEGGAPVSFKQAVFLTEQAYVGDALDSLWWEETLDGLVELCRAVQAQRDLVYSGGDKSEMAVHASIFSVMCDTLTFATEEGLGRHFPFAYDFDDIWGHGDWEKMFVSKLLATGNGNCHSLPYLYKILAEELGVEAWLSLAPNHVYIKNTCAAYGWYNTELTSGMFPVDAWLMASGYIHPDAVRNGIYMDTLSAKESVALCLVDLAQGYLRRHGLGDGEFVLGCCSLALAHSPDCINALLLLAETTRKLLISGPSSPESKEEAQGGGMEELNALYARIHRLGYRRMPEAMYVDWLVTLQAERDKYSQSIIQNQQPSHR